MALWANRVRIWQFLKKNIVDAAKSESSLSDLELKIKCKYCKGKKKYLKGNDIYECTYCDENGLEEGRCRASWCGALPKVRRPFFFGKRPYCLEHAETYDNTIVFKYAAKYTIPASIISSLLIFSSIGFGQDAICFAPLFIGPIIGLFCAFEAMIKDLI